MQFKWSGTGWVTSGDFLFLLSFFFCLIILFLNEGWSSQLYTQLLQLQKESLKKIQACTGFKPSTSAYQCSALPIKLTSLFVLQRSRVWILYKPGTAKVAYITAMIILCLILHSAVHIYDFHIFKTSSSSFHRFITNQIKNLLTVGFFA